MPENTTSFTMRVPVDELTEIDKLRHECGFATRSKFLRAAAQAYHRQRASPDTIPELARISGQLHRLEAIQREGGLLLLKEADLKVVRSCLRRLFRLALETDA